MKYDLPNGRKLVINQEECPESPRTAYDNLTTMVFIGKYSHLGDKHDFHDTHESFQAHQEFIENQPNVVHVQPMYAYVHSGMTIATTPFSCPWDSGKLGWVILTKEKIRAMMGCKRVTQKIIDKCIAQIEGEVKELDLYIQKEVYWFQLEDEDGNDLDMCGGFYGDDILTNGMLEHLSEEDVKFLKETV